MRLFLSCTALVLAALAAHAQEAAHGLTGTYYRGAHFEERALTRTDATLDFNWDYDQPDPNLPQRNFSVRWTGFIQAPVTGTYTFQITTDDGMRVWLGNQPMFDEWRPQVPSSFRRKVKMVAGQVYQLKVEYFQLNYQARAALYWQRPDEPDQPPGPIAASALFVKHPAPPKPPPPPVVNVPGPAVTVAPQPEPKPEPRPAPKPEPRAEPVPVKPTPRPASPVPVPTPTPPPSATPAAPTLASLGTLARGTTLEIKELFFEQSKARLLPTSGPAIERLVTALKANPTVQLEIAGHTDNVGDAVKNQRLSEERAQRIRDLLIGRGIAADRLTAVGYGGTRPVADNNDPAQRPRNRRVEITVR